MQALQAGGAGAPSGAPAVGPPPGPIQIGGQDSGSGAGGDGDGEQDLHEALDALHAFLQDDQDHIDKAQIAKCISIVQTILANRQKGSESALGITPAHKSMARAYQQ